MPIYEYRCEDGHLTQLVLPMADDKPGTVRCEHIFSGVRRCVLLAARAWAAPAAIHYKGAGTYTTDYKQKYDRKRRKNAGDDLPLPSEAAITRAEGAEHDPPKHLPGGVIPRSTDKKVSVAI